MKLACVSILMSVLVVIPVYAAGWQQDAAGRWWQNDDGSYPANEWKWIDENRDGMAECYYFGADGYVLTSTVTPDGSMVNADGSWVVDNVVQSKNIVGVEESTQNADGSAITRHTIKTSQTRAFPYLLYTPKDAAENMPLIVYLHSGVPQAKSINLIKEEDLVTYLLDGGSQSVPAYVVMPHATEEDKGWPKYDASLMELIDAVAEEYKIDRKRISIAGWSMGADGMMKFLPKHTDVFSCAAWISAFGRRNTFDYTQVDKLKEIPHWFIFEENNYVRSQFSGGAAAINAAGGQVKMTEVPGVNHETFLIFDEGKQDTYGVIDWLITQSK